MQVQTYRYVSIGEKQDICILRSSSEGGGGGGGGAGADRTAVPVSAAARAGRLTGPVCRSSDGRGEGPGGGGANRYLPVSPYTLCGVTCWSLSWPGDRQHCPPLLTGAGARLPVTGYLHTVTGRRITADSVTGLKFRASSGKVGRAGITPF